MSVACRQSLGRNPVQASSPLTLSLISLPVMSRWTVHVTVIPLTWGAHSMHDTGDIEDKKKGPPVHGRPRLRYVH